MATKKTRKANTAAQKETKVVAIDEISETSIEGICLAKMTGIKTGEDDMPLLTISLTDRRPDAIKESREITICPFRKYSFGVGGPNGGAIYGESTIVGFSNVISAAETYSCSFTLYKDATLSSNVSWGSASAAKALLRGLLCEALMHYLSNMSGENTILEPNFGIINKYIDNVYHWMDKYRNDTETKPIVKIKQLEEEIGGLNNKIAELSSEKEELEKEILRYKAAAAFSQVTIEELNKEREERISAKKELKKELKASLAKAITNLKK